MSQKSILVLGAGLSGLSTAWHLKRKGMSFRVFEKEREIGGLCRSKKVDGFTFDYDGHLLHFRNESTYNFVKEELGLNLIRHNRNSFIRYFNCDIPYPFQANFLKLPAEVAKECLEGLKTANDGHKKDYPSFKDWLYASFGEGIARHFMVPYNEKFWTVPASELTCEWFDGFIPVLKFKDIVNRPSEDFKSIGYNAFFYYPAQGGIEQLPNALAGDISDKIFLNSKITRIDIKNKKITVNDRQNISYDRLVSTLPLPELDNLIAGLSGQIAHLVKLLNYNSIAVFNFGVKSKTPSDKHWMYFPEKKNRYFRVGFYNSFSSSLMPKGNSSIYAEVSYPKGGHINLPGLEEEVINDLVNEGMIPSLNDIVTKSAINIKYGYPIYDHNYKSAVSGILKFLAENNIYSIGRYGSWRYMTMEDALLSGKNTAETL